MNAFSRSLVPDLAPFGVRVEVSHALHGCARCSSWPGGSHAVLAWRVRRSVPAAPRRAPSGKRSRACVLLAISALVGVLLCTGSLPRRRVNQDEPLGRGPALPDAPRLLRVLPRPVRNGYHDSLPLAPSSTLTVADARVCCAGSVIYPWLPHALTVRRALSQISPSCLDAGLCAMFRVFWVSIHSLRPCVRRRSSRTCPSGSSPSPCKSTSKTCPDGGEARLALPSLAAAGRAHVSLLSSCAGLWRCVQSGQSSQGRRWRRAGDQEGCVKPHLCPLSTQAAHL